MFCITWIIKKNITMYKKLQKEVKEINFEIICPPKTNFKS